MGKNLEPSRIKPGWIELIDVSGNLHVLGTLQIDGSVGIGPTASTYFNNFQLAVDGGVFSLGAFVSNAYMSAYTGQFTTIYPNYDTDLTLETRPGASGQYSVIIKSLGTTPLETMRCTSLGYLGIRTTDPQYTLDVSGNLQISSGYSLIMERGGGTNRNVSLYPASGDDNAAVLSVYPSSGTNVMSVLAIIPKGAGLSSINKTSLSIFNTDYVADSANWEALCLKGMGENLVIYSEKMGSSTRRPITISAIGYNIPQIYLTADGSIGIMTNNPLHTLDVSGNLNVSGAITAATKSFVINHPTKPGKKLQYGSLEGAEFGVYCRGKFNSNEVYLPDYWRFLVDEESLTVNLTSTTKWNIPYVKKITNNSLTIGKIGFGQLQGFYTIYGERKDVGKLITEK